MFGMNDSSKEKDNYSPAPTPERLKKNVKVAILTADKTEDLEFFYPFYRLCEAGYTVDVITPDGGKFAGKHGIGLNETKALKDCRAMDYALLYIPGGKAPAELRKNEEVLTFVREFVNSGKPVAAICHGPQVLISAGVVRGKTLAAYSEVAEELKDAGAMYADEALKIDGQFITARVPGDLPRHMCGVMDALEGKGKQDKFAA